MTVDVDREAELRQRVNVLAADVIQLDRRVVQLGREMATLLREVRQLRCSDDTNSEGVRDDHH